MSGNTPGLLLLHISSFIEWRSALLDTKEGSVRRELGFIFLPPTTLGSSESYQQERGVRHMKRKYIWKMLTLSSLRLALVTRSIYCIIFFSQQKPEEWRHWRREKSGNVTLLPRSLLPSPWNARFLGSALRNNTPLQRDWLRGSLASVLYLQRSQFLTIIWPFIQLPTHVANFPGCLIKKPWVLGTSERFHK